MFALANITIKALPFASENGVFAREIVFVDARRGKRFGYVATEHKFKRTRMDAGEANLLSCIAEEEEDEHSDASSGTSSSNSTTPDLSAQLALQLATLPVPPSTTTTTKCHRSCKTDFALLHELGVCAGCGIKRLACKKDKRARRAAVQDFDMLAMNLNAMLISADA